jgi:hypothetical protein
MQDKRQHERKRVCITMIVRKDRPYGGRSIMEFRSLDLSRGGLFIATENLSLFELGEELEILVDDEGRRYYEGKARVVRSARVFTAEGDQVESGYGLMFVNPGTDFRRMLFEKLDRQSESRPIP